jgi:putative inorganic carbon (HCO3(-)) transporter
MAGSAPGAARSLHPWMAYGAMLGLFGLLAAGVTRSVVPVAIAVAVGAGLWVVALRPHWAIAVFLLATPVSLIEVAGGMQVVQILGIGAAGSIIVAGLIGGRSWHWSPVVSAALLVLAVNILSLITSDHLPFSIRVVFLVLLSVLLLFATLQAAGDAQRTAFIMRAWLLGMLTAIIPVIAAPADLTASQGGGVVSARAAGVFGQPNYLGAACVLTIFVAVALLWSSQRRLDHILAIAGILACTLGLLLSLSRGALLGAAAGVLLLALLAPQARVALAAIGTLAVAALGLAFALGNPLAQILVLRVQSIASADQNAEDNRVLIWEAGLRMWRENPLLGVGTGAFRPESSLAGSPIAPNGAYHAHNVVLNVGAETGLLGVAALVLAAFIVIWVGLRATIRRSSTLLPSPAVAALLSGLGASAVHGMVDFLYGNPMLGTAIGVYLGIYAAATRAVPTSPIAQQAGTTRATIAEC